MCFALYASEVAEIGGKYLHVFTLVPRMLSHVVIQRIRLSSEAWAVLEGHLSLFSFTSHVFIHVFVLHGPIYAFQGTVAY